MKRLIFLNTQMCQFEWEYRVERVGHCWTPIAASIHNRSSAGRLSPPRITNEAPLEAYRRLESQTKLRWTPITASYHNRSSAGRLSPPRITNEAPLEAHNIPAKLPQTENRHLTRGACQSQSNVFYSSLFPFLCPSMR